MVQKIKLVSLVFFICLKTPLLQAQEEWIAEHVVCYDGKSSILPPSWLGKKIKARITAADTSLFHQDTAGLASAWSKIPLSVLETELQKVYVVGSLKFNGQRFTGSNSDDAIYIVGGDKEETERTFHHELSSILLRNHPDDVFEATWRALSPALRTGNSASAVKAGYYSVKYDESLMEKGYLTSYSLSNWENDFNMYAENIFWGGKQFWVLLDKYPKALEKARLTIKFYREKIWGGFSETFFRGL